MDIKKVELVNVPEPNTHKVEVAKVKSILIEELQIGDLILFGFNLLSIQDILCQRSNHEVTSFRISALNLSNGLSVGTIYPTGTVLHRVIDCEITELDKNGDISKWYGWKRLRKPILGEMTVCGICQGDCEPVLQYDIDVFNPKDAGQDCGSLAACYEPTRDVFLSYDGCEDLTHHR